MNLDPSKINWAAQPHPVDRVGAGGTERTANGRPARSPDASPVDAGDASRIAVPDLVRYVAMVRTAPSGRAARIDALRQAVADGTYDISIDRLSERLLGNG